MGKTTDNYSIVVYSIARLSSHQVLHITNAVFIVFNIACAFAPSTGSLIAFRFLGKPSLRISFSRAHNTTAGVAGSAPIAIGGGVVGDLFNPHDRASAMAIYTLGPLIGMHLDSINQTML